MPDLKSDIVELQKRIVRAHETIKPEGLDKKIKALEAETMAHDFWETPKKAREITQHLSQLVSVKEIWEDLERQCHELYELCQIINEEHEPEAREEIRKSVHELKEKLRKAEIALFLKEQYDHNNAILSVHAGTGGTDAHDWADRLLRMYLRYAEQKGCKTELLDKSVGEDAGIKSATIKISGPYAYGYLKEEAGVHRLVRLSPFNVGHTRETSFALVEVIPELKEEQEFEIKPDDLRIDFYGASGPGGQNVNTSNSAVRITHLPTKLVVTCQSERSQTQNKETALKILKGKLIKLREKERTETIDQLKGEYREVSFGHQIRSYVLHPYQMVKDHRTNFETSQVEKTLDGEMLDEFIEASLEMKVKGGEPSSAEASSFVLRTSEDKSEGRQSEQRRD